MQAARLLPLLRRAAHGGNRRPSGRLRDPPVPVRQWVLSLPIPLRLLLAAQPQLLAPLLQAIHRVIAGFLVKRAGFKLSRAHTGAVTLIQRFGSAANLNIVVREPAGFSILLPYRDYVTQRYPKTKTNMLVISSAV